MTPVDILIYSKDRALQLDLLLRSIKKNFKNANKVVVLHKWSNNDFEAAYNKLFTNALVYKKYELDIIPLYETNFKEDLKDILTHLSTPNFLGLCDDDVFIKKCDISEALHELENEQVNAISLKSGYNITHHYPNIVVPFPQNFIQVLPFLKWNWKTQPRPTDWGYPTCINSYIYNVKYYLSLLEKIEVNHPTVLEAQCNTIREFFRPIMIGVRETCLLNIPCNRLQTVNDTPYGTEYAFTTEELNQKYLDGYIIDTNNIYNKEVDRPNLDIGFKFKKESSC